MYKVLALVAFLAQTLSVFGVPVDMEERAVYSDNAVQNTSPHPTTDTTWRNTVLEVVDAYRHNHSTLPFVWSNTLSSYALEQANKCQLKHSDGPYGENIYWISSSSLNFTQATQWAVEAWMSEEPQYSPENPYNALHYTALVWKGSKRIGCAWTATTCPSNENGGFYFFCEFDPMGNILGYFPQNVS
jgi:pathogenesis-related protein 1